MAEGKYEKLEAGNALRNVFLGSSSSRETKKTEMIVRYQGQIVMGCGGNFSLVSGESGLAEQPLPGRSLLSSSSDGARDGLMFIAEDGNQIMVYEKGDRKTEKFYSLTRKR
ncbi:MAG: hypothetical protein EPO63_08645 [Candidatus Nitrosotenuis sp.]|nr:MAG: hypothetical protein EPO63_08645 [Candidatus Nitrosotenuis sp.]